VKDGYPFNPRQKFPAGCRIASSPGVVLMRGHHASRIPKENLMTSFILSFRNDPNTNATDDELAAWGAWFQGLGSSVTDMGSRVANTTVLGIGAGANALSGYTIVEAADAASALEIAKGCPGLKYNGSVEVGELIAM
jgi:hypothetical protein